jgi:hypothetical protein
MVGKKRSILAVLVFGLLAGGSGTAQAQVSVNDLVGVWEGSYRAGQGETGMTLSVFNEGGNYRAIWDFYNLPGRSNSAQGKFYMRVSYNQSTGNFFLEGYEWIERPNNYSMANLEGTITGDVFSGFLSGSNYAFQVVKRPPDEPTRLCAGDTLQGEMDIYDALDWMAANAQDGDNYLIDLGSSQAIASQILDYGNKRVTVSLKSSGGEKRLSFATRSPSVALFTVKAGVTFILEDGVTLAGQRSASRSLVNVDGGTFVMNEGAAIKDSIKDAPNSGGAGVFITNGIFTMNGGTISGNSASSSGGGVLVRSGAFTMNGGTIGRNNSNIGGGVILEEDGTFTMNGGTISGNTAGGIDRSRGGGGGIFMNGGTFTMNNGTISGNTARRSNLTGGGGIYMAGGTFTMNSGALTGNTSGYGGGVCVERGMFTMSGGAISGNDSSNSYYGYDQNYYGGGGVYVNGTFMMTDGEISGNTAYAGGGVWVNRGTFTISGGAISGNTAGNEQYSNNCVGGGVYVGDGTFTINGGTISGNTASGYFGSTGSGGGVYINGGTSTMTNGIISGNTTSRSGGGVYVGGAMFTKSGSGGIIYGSDAPEGQANKAGQYGHAVYTGNGSRDTTARANRALDSTINGPAGGWE